MFFFIFFRKCYHDYFQSMHKPTIYEHNDAVNSIRSQISNIRIYFDYSWINTSSDKYECTDTGQVVSWSMFSRNITCSSEDILTEKKRKAIINTLENIKKYVSSMIKVNQLTSVIFINEFDDFPCIETIDADLYVTIVARPFPEHYDTVSGSVWNQQAIPSGRPTTGAIFINPKTIPDEEQNIDSENRYFFNSLLHQLFHIMGISASLFESWNDPTTHLQYGVFPLRRLVDKNPNKVFVILETPNSRTYTTKRFGRPAFADHHSGIEIEGNETYAESHISARTYFSEIMNSQYVGRGVISEASLTLLSDTGWYYVDLNKSERFDWGDGKSIGEEPLGDFPMKPPQLCFPEHYLCKNYTNASICSYDYRSKATCAVQEEVDCNQKAKDTASYCSAKSFFNPLGLKIVKMKSFDYQNIKVFDNYSCASSLAGDELSKERGESFGPNSYCAVGDGFSGCYEMYCGSLGILYMKVGDSVSICEDGKEIKLPNKKGTVKCPPKKHICSLAEIDDRYTKVYVVIETAVAFAVIIIISFVALCVYCISIKENRKDTSKYGRLSDIQITL